MRTFDELEKAVAAYCERHGHTPKHTKRRPNEKYLHIEATDYTSIEARIMEQKNGKTRVLFKVDGKVTSIKK